VLMTLQVPRLYAMRNHKGVNQDGCALRVSEPGLWPVNYRRLIDVGVIFAKFAGGNICRHGKHTHPT
jgi:hypothetical protein